MIILIIKSYLNILLPVSIGCIIIFILGLILIFKKMAKPLSPLSIKNSAEEIQFVHEKNSVEHDVSAIAGDSLISTQLDLARAYIETGEKILAKQILDGILEQGNDSEKQEALQLLHYTSD